MLNLMLDALTEGSEPSLTVHHEFGISWLNSSDGLGNFGTVKKILGLAHIQSEDDGVV